jgi:hypothetical protein
MPTPMTDIPSTAPRETARDDSAAAPGTGKGASLLIRLWTLPRADVDPAARNWREESSVVAMLADLVSACRGKLAEGYQQQLMAEFPDLPTALTAARRIERAMVGFASHQPRSRAAAAIGIFSRAGESAPSPAKGQSVATGHNQGHNEMETAGMLISAATAGQILLTQAAYSEITRALPQTSRGISSVRLTTPDGGPALEAFELVWGEPETYLRFRKLVEGMEWAHATASHRGQQTQQRQQIPQTATRGVDLPPDRAGNDASVFKSAGEPPSFAAKAADVTETPDGGEATVPTSVWQRTPIRLGVGAAALVVVAVLLITKLDTGHFRPSRPVDPSSKQASDNPRPVDAPPAASSSRPSGGAAEQSKPVQPSGAATAAGDTPAVKPDAVKPEPKIAKDAATNASPTAGSTTGGATTGGSAAAPGSARQPAPPPLRTGREPVDGFYRKDIPSLLARAERESGNGNYGSAKYCYGVVLQLDPGNGSARQELNRVTRAEALDER